MFDKVKFAKILNDINNAYDTMTEFAKKSEVNRTYLSQYINMKLDSPPTPKILKKIADASHRTVSYNELMNICGYLEKYSLSSEELLNIDIERTNLDMELKKKLSNLNLSIRESDIALIIARYIDTNSDFNAQISTFLNDYSELDDISKQKIADTVLLFNDYDIKKIQIETKTRNVRKLNFDNDILTHDDIFKKRIQGKYGTNSINLLENYNKLNDLGKQKANDNIEDLTKITEYTEKKQDSQANG